MPIYKMDGKKNGLQKYRVRINYTDKDGKAHQVDRVAYGNDAAKNLERELMFALDKTSTQRGMTIEKLYDDYIQYKQYEVRATTQDKTKRCLQYHIHCGILAISKILMYRQKKRHCIIIRRNSFYTLLK